MSSRHDLQRALAREFPIGSTYQETAEILGKRVAHVAPLNNAEVKLLYGRSKVQVQIVEKVGADNEIVFAVGFTFSEQGSLVSCQHVVSVVCATQENPNR